jgi:hypothetical protein
MVVKFLRSRSRKLRDNSRKHREEGIEMEVVNFAFEGALTVPAIAFTGE